MRTAKTRGAMALVMMGAFAAAAYADDVPGVFDTGVDDDGLVLAVGTADPHWDLVDSADPATPLPSAAIIAANHFAYVPNDAVGTGGSSWVSTTANTATSAPIGSYTFQTEIDLADFDPATAVLSGRFASDNEVVDVLVNGESQGELGGAFAWWTDFAIDRGFVDGVNTIAFVVANVGADPMGFRVEWTGTADLTPIVEPDPEPRALEVDLRARQIGKPCWLRFLRSTVPVAVLSTDSFDATTIDPATVLLDDVGIALRHSPPRWVARWCARFAAKYGGVSSDGEVRFRIWQRDVDRDGRVDLVMRFPLAELSVEEGVNQLDFSGVTTDGSDVKGTLELVSGCR